RRENANRPRPTNTNSPNSTTARRVRLKAMRPLTIERVLPYPHTRSTGVRPRHFECPDRMSCFYAPCNTRRRRVDDQTRLAPPDPWAALGPPPLHCAAAPGGLDRVPRARPGYPHMEASNPAPAEALSNDPHRSQGALFRSAGNRTILSLGWRRVTY